MAKNMDCRIKNILKQKTDNVQNYNWEMIEKENNIVFPDDYKWFLENYGVGSINDFLWVLSPTCSNLNLNSFEQYRMMKKAYEFMKSSNLIDCEYSFYNNGIGLFPWGLTDNGDELYWNYLIDRTEIVLFSSRCEDILSYKMNMDDFLSGVLAKEIECQVFPDDFVLDDNYFASLVKKVPGTTLESKAYPEDYN